MTKNKTCTVCKAAIELEFHPMKEWENIKGPICGKCYSKKIHDHYPGEHVRINKTSD